MTEVVAGPRVNSGPFCDLRAKERIPMSEKSTEWQPMTSQQTRLLQQKFEKLSNEAFYALGQIGISFDEMDTIDMHGLRCVGLSRWWDAARIFENIAKDIKDTADEIERARLAEGMTPNE